MTLIVPLVLAGCAPKSNNQSQSKSSSSSSTQTTAQSDSQSSSATTANQTTGPRALKVQYQAASFTTTLDHEYYEEHLYKYVPGSVDRNKTYTWILRMFQPKPKFMLIKRQLQLSRMRMTTKTNTKHSIELN